MHTRDLIDKTICLKSTRGLAICAIHTEIDLRYHLDLRRPRPHRQCVIIDHFRRAEARLVIVQTLAAPPQQIIFTPHSFQKHRNMRLLLRNHSIIIACLLMAAAVNPSLAQSPSPTLSPAPTPAVVGGTPQPTLIATLPQPNVSSMICFKLFVHILCSICVNKCF